jgi:hypothetical protein
MDFALSKKNTVVSPCGYSIFNKERLVGPFVLSSSAIPQFSTYHVWVDQPGARATESYSTFVEAVPVSDRAKVQGYRDFIASFYRASRVACAHFTSPQLTKVREWREDEFLQKWTAGREEGGFRATPLTPIDRRGKVDEIATSEGNIAIGKHLMLLDVFLGLLNDGLIDQEGHLKKVVSVMNTTRSFLETLPSAAASARGGLLAANFEILETYLDASDAG